MTTLRFLSFWSMSAIALQITQRDLFDETRRTRPCGGYGSSFRKSYATFSLFLYACLYVCCCRAREPRARRRREFRSPGGGAGCSRRAIYVAWHGPFIMPLPTRGLVVWRRPPKPPRNDTAAGPLPGRFPPPRPRSKPTFPPFPPAVPANPTGFPPTPECSLFAVDGCSLSALETRALDGTGRSVGDRRDYVIIAVRYTFRGCPSGHRRAREAKPPACRAVYA